MNAGGSQQPSAGPAPAPASTGSALPEGTVVSSLPGGCTSQPSGGVTYYQGGPNYCRAVFQGNDPVYVTVKP